MRAIDCRNLTEMMRSDRKFDRRVRSFCRRGERERGVQELEGSGIWGNSRGGIFAEGAVGMIGVRDGQRGKLSEGRGRTGGVREGRYGASVEMTRKAYGRGRREERGDLPIGGRSENVGGHEGRGRGGREFRRFSGVGRWMGWQVAAVEWSLSRMRNLVGDRDGDVDGKGENQMGWKTREDLG